VQRYRLSLINRLNCSTNRARYQESLEAAYQEVRRIRYNQPTRIDLLIHDRTVAGGFDAIYLLIVDLPSANVLERVQSLWASYTEISVSPLSCVADNGGLQHHSTLADVAGLSETLSP
jgi:hypothetical protein